MDIEAERVHFFRVERFHDGRWEVSTYRDHCWRGAVRADTLEEAWKAAAEVFDDAKIERAFGRASADIDRDTDKQADVIRLLHQVAGDHGRGLGGVVAHMTTPSDRSDTERWYRTLLEISAPEGWLVTLSLVQRGSSGREAAEKSAGFQLGDGWRPRRILVYEGEPEVFEWRQVRPYLYEVGKRERA